jgi:anti-sigma factor RsiW
MTRRASARTDPGTDDRLGCHEVRRVLQAFLDGEIGAEAADLVAAHLESCTRCRFEADTLARVITELRRVRADLDPAAYARLVTAVDRLCDGSGAGPSLP